MSHHTATSDMKTQHMHGDFLFSKSKEEKKAKKNGKPESVMNKDSEALV